MFLLFAAKNFNAQPSDAPRVAVARKEKDASTKALFKRKNIVYPPEKIFIRIFKYEKILELWAAGKGGGKFTLVKTYKICRTSGTAGPKRREGDGQIPEGFYEIAGFNPYSLYYLSLKINYPNASDKILGDKKNPGGDIFIHGNCGTIGCVPITDEQIKELYVIALDARSNGQKKIPVHIYPARMNDVNMNMLKKFSTANDTLWNFWINLKEGYDYFETSRTLPEITVDKSGKYVIGS